MIVTLAAPIEPGITVPSEKIIVISSSGFCPVRLYKSVVVEILNVYCETLFTEASESVTLLIVIAEPPILYVFERTLVASTLVFTPKV